MKKNVLMLMAVATGFSAAAQTFKPALKLEPGKKYTVSSITKATMTQEAMGQSIEIPMESSIYQLLDIKAAAPEGYQTANTTQRIVFSMNAMGQDVSYDSDKKEDREGKIGETMNPMVGKTTTFTVDNSGRVIEKSIVKPVTKTEESGGDGDMMSSMMKNMGIGDNPTGPVFNLFPSGNEMKIGDSFVDSSSTNKEDDKQKIVNTYTLTSIKDGVAEFTLNGTTSLERKMEAQGMTINVSTTMKSTGSMLVDVASGLLSKKIVNVESTGNMEVSGMQMPMTGKTTTTIEVVPAR